MNNTSKNKLELMLKHYEELKKQGFTLISKASRRALTEEEYLNKEKESYKQNNIECSFEEYLVSDDDYISIEHEICRIEYELSEI